MEAHRTFHPSGQRNQGQARASAILTEEKCGRTWQTTIAHYFVDQIAVKKATSE